MTAHIHAHLMLQYAQDAATTDKPWELWEYRLGVTESQWWALHEHPKWAPSVGYRRKTKTIRIGEFDVPEPLRVAPEAGADYYLASPFNDRRHTKYSWLGDTLDLQWLALGLLHATEEAAVLHAKALISLSEVK